MVLKQIDSKTFSASMGLLMVSRELQPRAAILTSHMQVPTHTAREGECLYRRKKDIAKVIVKTGIHGFSCLSPDRNRRLFLLPVGLCYCPRVFVSFLSGLLTLFN